MAKRKKPEMVVKDGKAVAVILDIHGYQEMLEGLEDQQDLKELAAMRRRPLKFKKLSDFLAECGGST